MIYDVKFLFPHIDCDRISQKLLGIIQHSVGESRLMNFMTFGSYALITFDENDKYHYTPHVEEQEKYNRTKTNAIVYDLKECNLNDVYNKCILYHTDGHKIANYGFVLYNTETCKVTHKAFIDDDITEVIKSMYNTITSANRNKMLAERLKRSFI